MMNAIELHEVSKKFKETDVLNDVSMELEEGKVYGFEGRNGAGKSVLLKLICGLMIPSHGEVIVQGKNLKGGEFAEDVGVWLDNTGFLPRLSGFNNLKSIAIIKNMISDERIKSCIEMVGLNASSKKNVGKYSLGMKQRLGIAQAIMEEPKLLLLDEPMNGLDVSGIKEMRALLKNYNRQHQATILIASHNKEDLEELCDKVFHIEAGHIQERSGSN